MARVAFVKTDDRAEGLRRALDLFGADAWQGTDLFLKPNFNSADTPPGSTHDDTLLALVRWLQAAGVARITVGDRSGMGNTRGVMQRKDVFRMGDELGFTPLVFDELPAEQWQLLHVPGEHWRQGFALPKPVLAADRVVQTANLKTHRFGGHFTLTLKNSVGLAAKRVPGDSYDFMSELHSSPHQRRMIAELNAAYQPALVVLDAVEAFVEGGPDRGKLVEPQVMLVGDDRVAVDAVGVALLRRFGTTPVVSQGPIFAQEQLARAVELGIGVAGPEQIELATDDPESRAYAAEIEALLRQG
ncbi:MAG: DUF362 domain-containing protein [Chloroflexota bacterium]